MHHHSRAVLTVIQLWD